MRPRRTLVATLLRSFFWQIRPRSFCARSTHDSAARFAGTASPALLSQQAAPGSASACADARGRGWSGGCVVVRGSRERARHGHHQAMLERSRRLVRPFPDQTQEPWPVAVRRAHVLAREQVAAAWPAARVRGRPRGMVVTWADAEASAASAPGSASAAAAAAAATAQAGRCTEPGSDA